MTQYGEGPDFDSFPKTNLTSEKCRLCNGFLIDGIDDIEHRVCRICLSIVYEIFEVLGFKGELEIEKINKEEKS